MRRIGDRGTDLVTLVHKLVGAVWLVSAIVILVRVWPAWAATPPAVVAWNRVEMFARLGLFASAATFVIGLVYGAGTAWGFSRNRWVTLKWGLFAATTAAGAGAASLAHAGASRAVIVLITAQILALVASLVIGVFLERSRHAGRLP